ncbi:unnamed protein product [Paramecium sonneborni]|uniref:Uncharacterized protein n=1 Tax=Paramecium sonneborni TaxID=65129 RepID=A0A8S1M133_9CILI|nr:unnamed protein product [Paramecium sonneborni]
MLFSCCLLMLFLLSIQVNSQCEDLPFKDEVNVLNPQGEYIQELSEKIIQGEENVGFGIWMKYQPMLQLQDINDRNSNLIISTTKKIIVNGGYFIYLMEQNINKFKSVVVSVVIHSKDQNIYYNIYYSFKQSVGTLTFGVDVLKYEGVWIMFYVYFDQIQKQTTFGFYNTLDIIPTQAVDDVPNFELNLKHKFGGLFNYENENEELVILKRFNGLIYYTFTTKEENTFSNLEICANPGQNFDTCYDEERLIFKLSGDNQLMIGKSFQQFEMNQGLRSTIYILNGWLKLDQLRQSEAETVIFRITINQFYNDNLYIGDREALLKYYQSSILDENGFEISTYSYSFPIKRKSMTDNDHKISQFGEEFQELLINWHFFQYEFGTQNNNGQPRLQIYFPTIKEVRLYEWAQAINHFKQVQYYIYIGGDHYSNQLMKGFISGIKIEYFCISSEAQFNPICHYSCLTCDGPTQYNCLSCSDNSFRYYEDLIKSCTCQQGFVEIDNQLQCKSIVQGLFHISKQELELKCSKPGYSNCEGQNIQCNFGYFQFKNSCIKCPFYEDFYLGTQILCFDCIIEPKRFAETLQCSKTAETYHAQKDYVYKITERFLEEQNSFEIQFNDSENENNKIELRQGFISKNTCKQGYYYKDHKCHQCQEMCKQCQSIFECELCIDGFYVDSNKQCSKCTKCRTCLSLQQCYTCNEGQEYHQGSCITCGHNCKSCDEQGYCNYCIGSHSLYYISMDGRNCKECNIENCIYCFEYIINNEVYYTNLNVKFQTVNYDVSYIFYSCALCKENYFYNQNTQKCELKPLNDDCDFAIILNDSSQKCIKSYNNLDAIQNIDCPTNQYCKSCIKNYNDIDSFCIECEEGYYSSELSGQCKECLFPCQTCIQQNKQYQDFWKWKIKATYKFLQNSNDDNEAQSYDVIINLELICTSCQRGFILYEQQCIKDCDENCGKCEIIDGKSTCVQCYEISSSNFLKSVNSGGKCLQCPSNCIACIDRTKMEIYEINPYFILTNQNLHFTRKCYEKTNEINQFKNYFYDSFTQQISVCNINLQCYNKIIIKQNLYCSDEQFYTLKHEAILRDDLQFEQNNLWIGDLFDEDHYFKKFETPYIYQYLNEISIRQVQYEFTLIQDWGPECFLSQYNQIYQKIQQNVFSIQQVDLEFVGEPQFTILRVYSNLTFSNFSTISFKNFKFMFSNPSYNVLGQNYFPIFLFSIKQSLSLKIIDCTFITNNETDTNYSLTIKSNIPYSLYIENLIISNFYIYNSDIFTITSQQHPNENYVQLKNIVIKDSYFFNSSFLKFQAQIDYLRLSSIITQIQIKETKFIQSNFLISNCFPNYSVGSLFINSITLQNIILSSNSTFLYLPCIDQSQLEKLILNNSIIAFGSKFYYSNVINLQDLIINNTKISQSNLISNNLDYSKSQSALLASSNIVLKSFQIINVEYDEYQQILVINKYKEISGLKLEVLGLIISNCLISSRNQRKQTSYEQSMIFIECQICILNDIQIVRRYGLPEITVINSEKLEIKNLIISQNQQFLPKALHSIIECVDQHAPLDMYFYIYIGQYKDVFIDNLKVSNSLSFNNPFIILKGYDIMEKLIIEKIVIQNTNFMSNILIIFDANQHTSLISIDSQQESSVILSNVNFLYNHLNEYYQDLTRVSATTIFIQLQFGIVLLEKCFFLQNIVTNSSDSILYLKVFSFQLWNSHFQNNGLLNVSSLSQNLIFSQLQDLSQINFNIIFPIKSNGGNGYLILNILEINNLTINTSYSQNGGGFYITTQGKSSINILNSFFYNTISSLDSSIYSIGGCLFIDASSSKITFKMHNTIIDTSYSRYEGGAIYINPSLSYNQIEIQNLVVKECFSLQNSFFSYVLSKIETIFSQVIFKNIVFQITEEGFQKYFSQISDLSENDASNIATSNPTIFIQYGNITIFNCSFVSNFIQFLIKIEQAQNIIFSNVKVINSTVLQSPLFKFNLRQEFFGQLQISNLELSNIIQIRKNFNYSCNLQNNSVISELQCPSYLPQVPLQYSENDKTELNQQRLNCNEQLIFSNKRFNFSLIELDKFNNTHKLIVEKIHLYNVLCETCQFGLFRILQIEKQEEETLKFSQVTIKNCICGNTGCLSILQYYDESILKKSLLESQRILQQHNYDKLSFQLNQQINILDSVFINNTAIYGGSLFIIEVGILIKNSIFQNNSAQIGGAIYYYSQESQILILNSKIISNTAKVAGGVFLYEQSFQLTKELDIQLSNNNSTLYGQDIFEKPRSLTLSIDGGQTFLEKSLHTVSEDEIVEQIINKPYKILGYSEKMQYITLPTGRSISSYSYFDFQTSTIIPYNLTFRIIPLDKFQNQIKGLSKSICTLYPKVFNLSSQTEEINLNYSLSYYNVSFDEKTGDYNLDDLTIYFKPNLSNSLVLQLLIQCNSILVPQYENEPPYKITKNISNYKLLVNIKTFPCQLGEFLNTTSGGCTLCDTFQNQYQVQWNAQSCTQKDDFKIRQIKPAMIELRSGYWRPYYYSQTIEYCYHLVENCEGGWKPGDDSCITGHIGALCEQCDLYNIVGLGQYSVSSKYSCGSCDQIIGNILTIVFISAWTLISILMSVGSTVEMIKEFIVGLRLKSLGVTFVVKQASTAILIKVLTNYLQIISTIATFQLQVPSGLASVVNSVGSPIESMGYSLDCFLISITDIPIIYFRIIWSLLMAFSYIIIFFIIEGIRVITKSISFNISYVSTALIYVFIYLQPNIIGGLISLISFRIISDEYWIQGNVAYKYNTSEHAKWLASFCLPLLLLFSILIPLYFWFGVRENRANLDKTSVRQKWGYLYNEYKLHAYYWETIKILQKEFMIIVLTYYDDHVPIKASLVFLVLFGYSFLTTSSKPYMTGYLNYLDTQSTIVCAVSIILGSSIYTAQQSDLFEIVWPFYIIIGILNGLFILRLLIKILFAYFHKLNEQIDKIKELITNKFPNQIKRYPFIQEIFESRKKQQARVKERYAKIRNHLLPQARMILEYRKLNNFDLPVRIQTQIFENEQDNIQKNDRNSNDSNFGVNSPLFTGSRSKKIETLFKTPQMSKIYPELTTNYINQDNLKSSIHQSQN